MTIVKTERTRTRRGRFGKFGGRYVPETLMAAVTELEESYAAAREDGEFLSRLEHLSRTYAGRPTPLTLAERLTEQGGGARIYLKREDLAHTGAHKINNALGQVLLAQRMGKTRIIAETARGSMAWATATVCALLGLECVVYMGEEDIHRQAPNVFRMRLLGADVVSVTSGSQTLKDAVNEAMRDWVTNVATTYYVIGSVVGPHPYPVIVRDFQSVIGQEARDQMLETEGRLPSHLVACVGGGSNAMGLFHAFYGDSDVAMIGVEAAGHGIETGEHSASLGAGKPGVLHGSYSQVLQDTWGQVTETHSISAGLDYPGVGPELAYYQETERARFTSVTDADALEGFKLLARTEGIIPALESSHAIFEAARLAATLSREDIILVNLSGRGDKDLATVTEALGIELDQA